MMKLFPQIRNAFVIYDNRFWWVQEMFGFLPGGDLTEWIENLEVHCGGNTQ